MADKKEKHIHKFRRHRYASGNTVFFCAQPDCTVKITPALALGKRSICWRCGEPFILSEYSIRLAKPHCDNCHKPKTIPNDIIQYAESPGTPESKVAMPMVGVTNSVMDLKSRLAGVLRKAADEEDGEI